MDHESLLIDLKKECNFAYGELYKSYFPIVNHFILNNKGTPDDSLDIFQDTMIILVEKLRHDDFQLTASLKTYVFAIAKYLWFNKIRNMPSFLDISEKEYHLFFETIEQSIEEEKSYTDRLQYLMSRITDHCNRLLHDIFFKNKPIEEIQIQYGYSTRHNAQNQKHKCVEQIKKIKEQQID
ncbi:RNA polymerase sigma factor [Aquirufa beregesia]